MHDDLILVIDDNPLNLKLVRDLLQAVGYRTLEAPTGEAGIAAAMVHQPRLVLLDIQLPDTDGLAVLASLRAQPRTAALSALALTASAMPEDHKRILEAGFDGYLTKPIDIWVLLDEVGQHCARRDSLT
ncbi:MAG: response regulator [Chloroflexi bacterium]|nr:response regulator [Chloroflexota bacterium]